MATFSKRTVASKQGLPGTLLPVPGTPLSETPKHSQASLVQSLLTPLLLSPGSWCAKGFACSESFCFPFFMHLSYTLYWSFYFSVCMFTSLGSYESLTVFSCFYLLSLCVPDLCMLVSVYPYPSMYLSLCIS